jgi:hypothetical protein
LKLLNEIKGNTPDDVGIDNTFLTRNPFAQEIKAGNDK